MLTRKQVIQLWYNKIHREIGLKHNGVKGQKWGKRNGPPYPLQRDAAGNPIKKKRLWEYNIIDPETGSVHHLIKGSKLQDRETFAGKGGTKPLRKAVKDGLAKEYGGNPDDWKHCKAKGVVDKNGEEVKAEIHWFQEDKAGKHKFKIKEWLE